MRDGSITTRPLRIPPTSQATPVRLSDLWRENGKRKRTHLNKRVFCLDWLVHQTIKSYITVLVSTYHIYQLIMLFHSKCRPPCDLTFTKDSYIYFVFKTLNFPRRQCQFWDALPPINSVHYIHPGHSYGPRTYRGLCMEIQDAHMWILDAHMSLISSWDVISAGVCPLMM